MYSNLSSIDGQVTKLGPRTSSITRYLAAVLSTHGYSSKVHYVERNEGPRLCELRGTTVTTTSSPKWWLKLYRLHDFCSNLKIFNRRGCCKKNVCIGIVYKHIHIIIHIYIYIWYVRIYKGWRYSEFTVDNSWNALIKKNDQGTAGCRPDSPAIPSSSASCTSNCYRYVLSDMVDVGWVFLKMTPMLDVSLCLSLNTWYGKNTSLKTMLLNNDTFGSSMTYAYEFNIFQKTHPSRSTQSWFHLRSPILLTPHFNLAMNAKLPQHQHFSHFFLPNWENVGQAGQLVRPGSRVPMYSKFDCIWLNFDQRTKQKHQKKTRHQHPLNLELIRSISSTATLLHHTSPTSTPRTFCVSNNVTRRQRWAAFVSFRPLFKVSWDVNPKTQVAFSTSQSACWLVERDANVLGAMMCQRHNTLCNP